MITKEQAAENLSEAFRKNLMYIYAAAKTIRDEGTHYLNRGISNVVERDKMKRSWSALNEFCMAYETFLGVLREETTLKE